jgi:acetoacetate decarboxylase
MAPSEQFSVEPGLRGQLKKKQLPYAMGNVFPRWEEGAAAWWRNIDFVVIAYLTPAKAAAALLPSEFSLAPVRALGLFEKLGLAIGKFRAGDDLAAVMLAFAKYRAGGLLGPYNEVFQGIPCLYQGQPSVYCSSIYVDSDEALTAGRELLGCPKKIATIELNSSGIQFAGFMERRGVRAASISFTQRNELFSVPLPANNKVSLPAPYDQMLRLPEPTGETQIVPFSMISTRFIAGAIAPQHLLTHWSWDQGTLFAGEGRIEYAPSEADPLSTLPVLHVVGSALFKGDMAIRNVDVLTEMA